ncbi:MAG: hypothetical protein L6R36_005063 [Xanthoria steineri]|nr:MAG: hypothetical protein L6R36_005063 [Xanthoria steineri]
MSEDYPVLAESLRRHKAKTERDARALLRGPSNCMAFDDWYNTRHTMLNQAEVICVNGPPGLDRYRVIGELVVALDSEPISVLRLVNDEIENPRSPYIAMLQTPLLNNILPPRMYVEVLASHLRKRVARGNTRFVLTDFPHDLEQAAIFEEDASLVRAFVLVEGRKPQQTTQAAWDESLAAIRPVLEKLEGSGRVFRINVDQEPRELDDDIEHLVNTLKSVSFNIKVLLAEDVFKPAAPSQS